MPVTLICSTCGKPMRCPACDGKRGGRAKGRKGFAARPDVLAAVLERRANLSRLRKRKRKSQERKRA